VRFRTVCDGLNTKPSEAESGKPRGLGKTNIVERPETTHPASVPDRQSPEYPVARPTETVLALQW